MSDDGMDPCECIWGHEMAMRRLLSLLRQSQSLCTTNECFNISPVPINRQSPDNNFLMMSLMIIFAVALFMLRPRAITSSDEKPRNSGPDSNGSPPSAPPPAAF